LQDRFEEDEATQEVECAIGPGGESFRKGGKEAFPGVVSEGFVEEGDAKVFGWKGALSET
jgi:hypothetical protein